MWRGLVWCGVVWRLLQAMKYPPVVAKVDGEALDRLELDVAELADELDDMEEDDGGDL
jgi:hypothetical protein